LQWEREATKGTFLFLEVAFQQTKVVLSFFCFQQQTIFVLLKFFAFSIFFRIPFNYQLRT